LAKILESAWRKGESLDLTELLTQVQKPPFSQLGAFPVETFFPEKERLDVALALNTLIAAPSFENWLEGEPLDVDALLWSPDGRPRVSIFYLAHLDDAGRMFFVTLLLEQVRAWMRRQSGTTDLRALLYFDELYGYLPPHPRQPPSKPALMALLKQGRALGLGTVVATQNPVDVDYKALSNAGTWMVGKLQTERDRDRALEGVAEAALEAGGHVDRGSLKKQVAGLESRTFLLHNVHAEAPLIFRTRWAMSYLRGPLTRDQIQALTGQARDTSGKEDRVEEGKRAVQTAATPVKAEMAPWTETYADAPPALPPGVRGYFLPVETSLEWAVRQAEEAENTTIIYQDKRLVYEPRLLAEATVRYTHTKSRLSHDVSYTRLVEPPPEGGFVDWERASGDVRPGNLETDPAQGALFAPLPANLTAARALSALRKAFADYLYREEGLSLWHNPVLKLYSRPDESEGQFTRRCRRAAEEARDATVDKLRDKYEAKLDKLGIRLRREERELEEDVAEYEARRREELLSAGESLLGFLGGRRSSRAISIQSRKRRLTQQAGMDVEESEEEIVELEEQIANLEAELEEELAEENERWAEAIEAVEPLEVRPTKSRIFVERFGLAWAPHWEVAYEDERTGTLRMLSLPAFGEA
jgi:hypothetical protein